MRFCTNCGSKLAEGDVFCTHCGSKVEASMGAAKPKSRPTPPAQKVRHSRPVSAPQTGAAVTAKGPEHTPQEVSGTASSAQAELQKTRDILFPSGAIPDYTAALVHLIEAKKMGAASPELDQLMLANQLYRTLDMLQKTQVLSHPELLQFPEMANMASPDSRGGAQRAQSDYSRNAKDGSSNQAANYMKAAAVGAVTGAVAQAATRAIMGNTAAASSGAPAHYVPVTDADMLTLMSDGGLGRGTAGPITDDYSPIPTVEAADNMTDMPYTGTDATSYVTRNDDDDSESYDDSDYDDADSSDYDSEGDYEDSDDGDSSDYDSEGDYEDSDDYDDSSDDIFDDDDEKSSISFFDDDDDGGSFFDDLF